MTTWYEVGGTKINLLLVLFEPQLARYIAPTIIMLFVLLSDRRWISIQPAWCQQNFKSFSYKKYNLLYGFNYSDSPFIFLSFVDVDCNLTLSYSHSIKTTSVIEFNYGESKGTYGHELNIKFNFKYFLYGVALLCEVCSSNARLKNNPHNEIDFFFITRLKAPNQFSSIELRLNSTALMLGRHRQHWPDCRHVQ